MLPLAASPNFVTLARAYRDYPLGFLSLKGVTLAQWAEESGWGQTKLAKAYGNYAGMKWGGCDAAFGSPVIYGKDKYTFFSDVSCFINGYWHRLDSVDVFNGWRDRTGNPEAFIRFIAPGWLTGRLPDGTLSKPEAVYVRDILDIAERRTNELFAA